jgi:putative Ca2+/H+ antiporter (TMEM165/GDT1 family)
MAEMGDKTQLATISLAVEYRAVWTVWMGTTLGMMVSNAIGIVFGNLMGKRLPDRAIKWGAAAIFVAFGLWGLWENLPREVWTAPVIAGGTAALAGATWLVARWGAGRATPSR